MPRGRPPKSEIRQNIVEILAATKVPAYGYQIFRVYRRIFPRATLRVLYYHLRKGITTGEFLIARVEEAKGEYSWGNTAEKVYYTLGPMAQPKGDSRVQEFLAQREVQ
ncbi:MAG TPA: hypothetical protein VJK52_02240 [Candidatus Nanoarchaeia archaeon]|nr:hypothetical protein [Candidatus Nanoarchaeia archaeon]